MARSSTKHASGMVAIQMLRSEMPFFQFQKALVYLLSNLLIYNSFNHKRCAHCSNMLSLGNYAALQGALYWYDSLYMYIFYISKLYLSLITHLLKLFAYSFLSISKPHFKQLFKLKGNYASGFGNETPIEEWEHKKSLRN